MAATHHLYYFNDAGQLSQVDWPPRTVSGTTVWDNYTHGTAGMSTTVPGDDGGAVAANVVLGSAGGGTSIWVAGQKFGAVLAVWRIDATDLTTILQGPIYHIATGAMTHVDGITDGNNVIAINGVDEASNAFIGSGYDDSNCPGSSSCTYLDAQSGHRLYSTLDAFGTTYDSGNKVDSNWDAGSPCPAPRRFHTMNTNWDRMQGVWSTHDAHKLFVWLIPYEDGDHANDSGGVAAWNTESVYYDIYARLDTGTTDTVTRISNSPGHADNAIFAAGNLNNSIGFDTVTNTLWCYLMFKIPGDGTTFSEPFVQGRIAVGSFSRSGAGFTLASGWTDTPCSRIDCVSPDGSQALGSIGDVLGEDTAFIQYFSVNHGSSWTTINTAIPGVSTQSLSDQNSTDGYQPQVAPARIIAVPGGTDRVGILVNWENDDDWLSHTDDDVTSIVNEIDLSIVAANPRIEVDTLTITLKDPDGTYVPANIHSSLYPNVRLARELRWNLTVDGITVCRFHGGISEYTALTQAQSSTGEQQARIRAESPLRALASAQTPITQAPSGVLVNPDGVTGVIPALLGLVADIIPPTTWALDPTPDSIPSGFLTDGMTIQTALEQCAIFADSIYFIRPHYRDTPSPKFYFVWKARGVTSGATADHVWTDTGGSIGSIVPRYTGDVI